MLSKNNIKYIRSLKLNKFRQKYNNFVVEGDKIAQEMLQDKNIEIENIFAISSWIETHNNLLKFHKEKLITITEKELHQISFLKTPNSVFVIAKQLPQNVDKEAVSKSVSLFLDGIQDPGNMGTIIRTADWFGIRTIFCSPMTVGLYNPKVLQSAMGAFLRANVVEMAFSDLVNSFPELPVYGTVLGGENIFKTKLSKNGIIVIGSEGRGISADVLQQLDYKITIPSTQNGGTESLNAAVATGIVCSIFKNVE